MAKSDQELPILIAGGGIGGLAAAYALARKGFPVRVLEQAPEFKELGAGIQLGPNIFKAVDKLGLKEALLANAWQPEALQMRCALSGRLVTRIPLDQGFIDRVPAALCGHPSLRHSCRVSQGLPGQQSGHAGKQPAGRGLRAGR